MARNCSLLGCDVESYHQHLKELWCLHLHDHVVQDNIGTLKWVLKQLHTPYTPSTLDQRGRCIRAS